MNHAQNMSKCNNFQQLQATLAHLLFLIAHSQIDQFSKTAQTTQTHIHQLTTC
jgi:hypothetical protein